MGKIPDSLQIGNSIYKVKMVSDLKSEPDENGETTGYYGVVSHTGLTIRIEQDMEYYTQVVALLHEAMHGIVHRAGHSVDIDGVIEERLVQCLSYGVVALMRDNPELIKSICKK